MKRKSLLLLSTAMLSATLLCAQHTPLTTQYLFNGLLIDPAYAGSRDALTANLTYRQQWVGFEGAPTTQLFSVHSPVNGKNLGLGLIIYNDRIGVSRETGFMTNYAYRMRLGKGKLALGLGAGLKMLQADWTTVRTNAPGDAEFATDSRGVVRPNFSAGAYYYDKRFFAGLSMPFILSQTYNTETESWQVANNTRQYQPMLTGGMLVDIDRNMKLKPSFLLRKAGGEPVQSDLNLNMIWKDSFWLGVSYRTEDAACFSMEVLPTKQLRVGYAYDLGISGLSTYQHGSHEVMVQYEFGYRVNARDPRYF
jgi:type IX secretion system PorP/SprF family membrane protein